MATESWSFLQSEVGGEKKLLISSPEERGGIDQWERCSGLEAGGESLWNSSDSMVESKTGLQ